MACDLSIIIVNYNVRYFLHYCLLSIGNASQGLDVQVIVVDNASSDDNYLWIKQKFPETLFVQNKLNQGFGKANNQGLELATGNLVLFLNPDTIVPENALHDCLAFFRKNESCGALGVHMMDGKGRFLPESKRSRPTPIVSFYKLSGLERFFPKSKLFGQYALGYLDENQIHQVPILAGAFMMVRRSLLEKVGGFDEAFFMYGEDIDLSYRLQNNTGFNNYFLGTVKVLHFKGESSKQDSLYYNKIFNDAMRVFVEKYHSRGQAFFMSASIRLGTWLKEMRYKTKGEKQKAKDPLLADKSFSAIGDSVAQQILQKKLSIVEEGNTNSGNLVFCIGTDYSYENALSDLVKQSTNVDFYWFAPETNSMIGSNKKDETGVVLKL